MLKKSRIIALLLVCVMMFGVIQSAFAITTKQNDECHSIIHWTAGEVAAIAASMAQLPGADNLLIAPLQTKMIIDIGAVFGVEVNDSMALAIFGSATAAVGSRAVSQWLIGWIPGWGNAVNASTAAATTEAIGWWAVDYFDKIARTRR